MCTCNKLCPKCDPGIEAFYQQEVEKAKMATKAHFEATGIYYEFEDNLDAKDIWYEYCALKKQEEIDDKTEDGDPSQWTY